MTALIKVYNENGTKIAQCDARCYDGSGKICYCVCGGINHGVGRNTAALNTLNVKLEHLQPQKAAPRAKNLRLEKHAHLADLTHPTFWNVH